MPIYEYQCPKGHRHDRVRSIDDRDRPSRCPVCRRWAARDVVASMSLGSSDLEYDRPIYSNALGVSPHQIDEARRRFPHHEFAPDGRMILRSHAQRKRVLKELGFVDLDGYS